ncbi:MAG TPA: hypothetical protein VLM90_06660 [Candidatus Deferrimicrobium sp.]|nr:hypothetical protein [Candidatus Deferrimicrobium sp.]
MSGEIHGIEQGGLTVQLQLADSKPQFHSPMSLTEFGADVRNRRGSANRSAKFLILLGMLGSAGSIGHAAESRYSAWFALSHNDDGFRLAPE